MNQKKSFPIFKWLLVAAGLGVLALVTAIIVALASAGPPSEEMRKIDRQYAEARRRLPAVADARTSGTTTRPALRPPTRVAAMETTQTAQPPASLSDQERCDWLFRRIIHYADDDFDYRENTRSIHPVSDFLDLRREAGELAGFYGKGIRVSAEAHREFKLPYARLLGQMMDVMVKTDTTKRDYSQDENYALESPLNWPPGKPYSPGPAEVGRMLDALHFRYVTGCPAWPSWGNGRLIEAHWRLALMLDPGGRDWTTPPPLPPAIESMDLQLLASRNEGEWDRFLELLIDMEREVAGFREEQTHPGIFFRQDWQRKQSWLSLTFKKDKFGRGLYTAGEFCGTVFDTIAYHRSRGRVAAACLSEANRMLDYATRASAGSPTAINDITFITLRDYTDQLTARALAAALELRRGKPVPARGSVTVESYIFDPTTRQPLLMFRSPAGTGVTRLWLAWPISQPGKEWVEEIALRSLRSGRKYGTMERRYALSVLLPAGHPGLAAVPELNEERNEEKRR